MNFVVKNISASSNKLLGLKLSNPYFFMTTVFAKISMFTETGSADQEQNKSDRHNSV